MYRDIIDYIRRLYESEDFIPLHAPVFIGNEKKYLNNCIDSTFVSYVGEYVNKFEGLCSAYTGSQNAIATVNGTAALQIALLMVGVDENHEVITQPLTFVATVNAIRHANAYPIFVDVNKTTLGLSPEKLQDFLKSNTELKNGKCFNKVTNRIIKACIPVHTFGHPCEIDKIVEICNTYNIIVVEDAAESLGSFYKNKHTGTFGKVAILSFNGNKTITTGGGGMILTDDKNIAEKARHITTTAKLPHKWEYNHDMVAYNYRMPNTNAAIGCAQMEQIDKFIKIKRKIAQDYSNFCETNGYNFINEPEQARSNFWLNSIILEDYDQRNDFLKYSNDNGVMTRPAWNLMNTLEMFKDYPSGNLENAQWLADRIVNLPSSVKI